MNGPRARADKVRLVVGRVQERRGLGNGVKVRSTIFWRVGKSPRLRLCRHSCCPLSPPPSSAAVVPAGSIAMIETVRRRSLAQPCPVGRNPGPGFDRVGERSTRLPAPIREIRPGRCCVGCTVDLLSREVRRLHTRRVIQPSGLSFNFFQEVFRRVLAVARRSTSRLS